MTDQTKRKRSRIACEPCRERKRKCNGDNPCDTCSQFDYQCYFDSHARKKRTTGLALSALDDYKSDASPPMTSRSTDTATLQNNAAHVQTINANHAHTATAHSHLRSIEANSGAAFMRRLALKMDPVNAPKLSLFAWNLGARGEYFPPPRSISEIISSSDMQALATVYFEKIHLVYGFIDRQLFTRMIDRPWQIDQKQPHTAEEEAVLCGVAALAYLFTCLKPDQKELELSKRARILLEQSIGSLSPSLDTVTGWMLRVVYLRLTATPHLAWMASCTLMHMIEAAGLHTEPSPDSVLHRPAGAACNPEVRRRLFGVAQHLNIWISFDLGRSRVALRGISSLPPSPRPEDVTTHLLEFLPLSESLDPDRNPDSPELEAVLSSVLESVPQHPASTLTQCNLMLCVYRRLRALNHNISGPLLDRVLASCARGTQSARDLLDSVNPWHHVAYSPFQIICTLLVIDTRAALSQLEFAMETLGAVVAVYDTPSMKEAYSTARLLVLLHQKRKEEDARILSGALNVTWQLEPASVSETTSPATQRRQDDPQATYSWLDDLTTDMPGLQDFDWNQFLADDTSWYMDLPNV